ncbi:hypothetical protein Q5752_004264 [Cryptotrichosporon argae]
MPALPPIPPSLVHSLNEPWDPLHLPDPEVPDGSHGRKYRSLWATFQVAPADSAHAVEIALNVPTHGVVFMAPPEEARVHAQMHGTEPTWDHLLSGELVLALPAGHPPVRYARIAVGFYSQLWTGLNRGNDAQVHELFRREIASDDGGVLEDTMRFDFSLILPSNLAARDRVGDNSIVTNLYAELVGAPIAASPRSPASSSTATPGRRGASERRTKSRSSSRARPAASAGAHERSPSPLARTPLFGTLSRSLMSLTRADGGSSSRGRSGPREREPDDGHADAAAAADEDGAANSPIPRPPGYAQPAPAHGAEPEMLQGTFHAEKVIRVIHNPDPAGGTTELDEHMSGQVDGLGQFDVTLYSDVWSISAMFRACLILSDLPPTATVYSFRVHLDQTHHVRVPSAAPDAQPLVYKRRFLLVQRGAAPDSRHVVPSANAPALWRGRKAGGKDDGVLMLECQDRVLRDDLVARPSTPRWVTSPIHVSHNFVVVVHFSTYGTDAYGKPLRSAGPGALRELRITRPAVLPTCALVPRAVNLPDYEHPEQWAGTDDPLKPWNGCACAFSDAHVEERMRAALARHERIAREHETAEADAERAKARLLARNLE